VFVERLQQLAEESSDHSQAYRAQPEALRLMDARGLMRFDDASTASRSSNTTVEADVIFANAGGGEFVSLADTTPQHLEKTFQRNVFGTAFTVQKLLPSLNDGASIILSGSTAASEGIPAFGAYSASKAAVRSFGRAWAAELADRRIRVNTIVPVPIETPGLAGLAPSGQKNKTCLIIRRRVCRCAGWDMSTKSPLQLSFWPPTKVRT
jgi:NAD(P)-dependent dehydrogenase (short-subunit alcohol dehydrogenase family)